MEPEPDSAVRDATAEHSPALVLDTARRVLVRWYSMGGALSCSIAAAMYAVSETPGPDRFVMYGAGVVSLIIVLGHKKLSLLASAGGAAVAIGLATTCNAFFAGGLAAPGTLWLVTIPLTMGLLAGQRAMVFGLTGTAALLTFLGVVERVGLLPLSTLDPDTSTGLLFGNLFGLSVTLGFLMLLSEYITKRTSGVLITVNSTLRAEVDEHERTRRELEELYTELVDIARRAGMGEVATGVLHNVGNAINGVTTSVSVALSAMDQSARSLDQVSAILEDPNTSSEKRALIPAYLRKLDTVALERRNRVRGELVRIREAADHVVSIVHAQQELATTGGMIERVTVGSLLDQAHLLLAASLLRHEIALVTVGDMKAVVSLDRHRAVQILINLVANARDALRDERGARSISITVRCDSDMLSVDVVDTGPGISPEVAARVFEHGFTTKPDGHGFGLHSSALAAKEMGGELSIVPHNSGAHFQLRVPNLARPLETAKLIAK